MKPLHAAAVLLSAAMLALPARAAESFYPFDAPADPDAPRIVGLKVTPVARLVPGVQLHFQLRGTPGMQASLRIDGAERVLGLAEVAPGRYQGIYTIGLADHIASDATVIGNLRRGEQLGMALLADSLERGRRGRVDPQPT